MSTINNDIPFVPENTTDPAAGLNLSLNVIDALLQIAVVAIQNTPPGSPTEGQRYIVGTAGAGDWAGQDNRLARYLDGSWSFYDARIAVNLATGSLYFFDGTTWGDASGAAGTALQPGDNVSELVNDAGYITSSSVITDHGALTGLGDDDHTQYHNDARGDARYAQRANNLSDLASASTARTNLGLGTFATYNYSGAPFINVMPDSGRFAGKMNPLSLTSGAYQNSVFFNSYNGSTFASAGKFIFDNSTHGGTLGALTATVDALVTAMGRTSSNARYGSEFHVSEITAGGGTASPSVGSDSVTRYPLFISGLRTLFASNSYGTFSTWINVAAGSAHSYGGTLFVNGSPQPSGYVLPAGWNHIRVVGQSMRGYDSAFPRIASSTDAIVEIACPAFFTGIVDTGIHTSPIPTINELSA